MSDGEAPAGELGGRNDGVRATAAQTLSESEKKRRNSSGIEFNAAAGAPVAAEVATGKA